ncbi:uncharacterized protein LOC143292930 isoform X2 [Babylonia areolata]|uniref:uncharacterized protein LOC143292930 isoform X2 n=1 Tax=Babylonia areolata TaxID=304850 RepID=UPI003FD008A3
MGTHRIVFCLGAATGMLTVVCLTLIGVLVWREVFTDRTPEPKDPSLVHLNNITNITEIRLKFPGYFRTPEEQERLEKANANLLLPRPVRNESRVFTRCFTNGYCERQTSPPPRLLNATTRPYPTVNRTRRQVSTSPKCELDVYAEDDLTFHGCCVSYSDLLPLTTLPTAEPGQQGDVTIAQFPALKQYFETQQCCQAQNCTGCQCSQTYYVVSAVVARPSGKGTLYRAEYVQVPGCCKCLNIEVVERPARESLGERDDGSRDTSGQ